MYISHNTSWVFNESQLDSAFLSHLFHAWLQLCSWSRSCWTWMWILLLMLDWVIQPRRTKWNVFFIIPPSDNLIWTTFSLVMPIPQQHSACAKWKLPYFTVISRTPDHKLQISCLFSVASNIIQFDSAPSICHVVGWCSCSYLQKLNM